MAQSSRIPTPLKQHWYRFRVGTLPLISFLGCVVLMLWLWERQAYHGSFVGEVATTSVDVKADIAGQLAFPPAEQYWQLYDPVEEGAIVARLDERPTRARLATVQAESKRLQAELAAAQTNLLNRHLALEQQHASDQLRLLVEVERRVLDLGQLRATIMIDQADLAGLEANLENHSRAITPVSNLSGYPLTDDTLLNLKRQVNVVQERITTNETIFGQQQSQLTAARNRLGKFADLELPDVETVLQPIREGILVQQSIMEEINIELSNLSITAPISGIISAIHHRPGQRIVAGDPIVTISKSDSQYIVSYVREHQQHDLREGMTVGLKLRQPGSPEFTSTISEVGPHVEMVPIHQLKDQTTMEWATPVKIPIPNELQLENVRPGQLLNVIIREPRRPFWSDDRAR